MDHARHLAHRREQRRVVRMVVHDRPSRRAGRGAARCAWRRPGVTSQSPSTTLPVGVEADDLRRARLPPTTCPTGCTHMPPSAVAHVMWPDRFSLPPRGRGCAARTRAAAADGQLAADAGTGTRFAHAPATLLARLRRVTVLVIGAAGDLGGRVARVLMARRRPGARARAAARSGRHGRGDRGRARRPRRCRVAGRGVCRRARRVPRVVADPRPGRARDERDRRGRARPGSSAS